MLVAQHELNERFGAAGAHGAVGHLRRAYIEDAQTRYLHIVRIGWGAIDGCAFYVCMRVGVCVRFVQELSKLC